MKGKAFICPTLAIDDITLPDVILKEVVGGSAAYASLACSLFAKTILGSIVGKDFPKDFLTKIEKRGVDVSGVQRSKKSSFRWVAKYSDDLREVTTKKNEMNAFEDFKVSPLKKKTGGCSAVFISNIDPEYQLELLKIFPKKTIKILDSMDLWMIEKRTVLKKALKLVDVFLINEVEAKVLVDGNPPIPELIETIMSFGPRVIIYKRGEYGLTMYGKMGTMTVPSYPFTYAVDPTGAGDALGGTIAGVLAAYGKFDKDSMTAAVLLGGVVASFTVEDYGVRPLEQLTLDEVLNRAKVFIDQMPNMTDLPDKRLFVGKKI